MQHLNAVFIINKILVAVIISILRRKVFVTEDVAVFLTVLKVPLTSTQIFYTKPF